MSDNNGTWAMAVLLTDPAVEDWIQATARSAPPMSEDQRLRLARLLRIRVPTVTVDRARTIYVRPETSNTPVKRIKD